MRRTFWGVVTAIGLLVDCRCRTTYEPELTDRCTAAAAAELDLARDGGAVDLSEHKRRCEDCCRAHGADAVDPGPCACGRLGLDVLLK